MKYEITRLISVFLLLYNMVEKVTVEHIEYYIDIKKGQTLSDIPDDYIYEAMCEMIVNLNPDYEVEKLAHKYNDSNMDKKSVIQKKLDVVLSEELKEVITIKQYENWVNATLMGIEEYNNM